MLAFFKTTFQRLLASTQLKSKRYLYTDFKIRNRLTGLVGARGVGKSTLLLQYIKEHHAQDQTVLYFSADHVYFNQLSLIAFITQAYQEGFRLFFIDEVHQYQGWNQELKNIHDSFPDIKIVFSGSSSIDLVKGSYDLSRRAKLYTLQGLSFREYLEFVHGICKEAITFDHLVQHPEQYDAFLSDIPKVKVYFKDYLKQGFYPFVLEDPDALEEKVLRIIEKNIYEDIANFYNLKTQNLHYFSKILAFLSDINPGELSINNLAHNLNIDYKTTQHYMEILKEIGLIRLLSTEQHGNARLRKSQKAYLHNTTLLSALSYVGGDLPNPGMLRECFFLQALGDQPVFYSQIGDFQTQGYRFEVGGKSKTKAQLAGKMGYVVKDDILVTTRDSLPLMLFGFLY